MELNLTTATGRTSKTAIEVKDAIFGRDYNEALIHQVVTAYLAGGRAGTKAQKTRTEVRGGGSKPWRQKGTGRARAGSIRSPLWRGGGIIFAAKPRDHAQKVNKKMYRGAMRSILSELVRQDRLVITESFSVDAPKTRALVEKLTSLDLDNVLVVLDGVAPELELAARNLPKVEIRDVSSVEPVSLIRFDKVLATKDAVKKLEDMLA